MLSFAMAYPVLLTTQLQHCNRLNMEVRVSSIPHVPLYQVWLLAF